MKQFLIPELLALRDEFHNRGFSIRLVGGCVRDYLLGETPKDIDLATDATPLDMMEMGTGLFAVHPTGFAHGTCTFVYNREQTFEVTTLRLDHDTTDGRHAEVEYVKSFEEDCSRRDFTINAMSMDFDGTVYDYFGGKEDLLGSSEVKLRFVGDIEARIREDYLRILRYFRFAARFSAAMSPRDLRVIEYNRSGLKNISYERIWAEMKKLFEAPDRVWAFKCMRSCHVDTQIGLPRPDGFSSYKLNAADCGEAAISLFFFDIAEVESFCQLWKMSNLEKNKIVWLVKNQEVIASNVYIENFLTVDRVPKDWIVSWALLQDFDPVYVETFVPPVFPVTGQDMLDIGFAASKELGQKLSELKTLWVNSRFALNREELLGILKHND